jgi:hypothetical protein
VLAVIVPGLLVDQKADTFAGAAAAVIAILAAVATFGCSAVYQAQSGPMNRIRRRHGRQLRYTWIFTVGSISCSAVVSLLAIPIAYWSPRIAFGMTLAALGVSAAATWRSLDQLNLVFRAAATIDDDQS